MNFTLHWLRRDFRRHALWLILWALAIAIFTWARVWFRMHQNLEVGDRGLWLGTPALALGLAEVCILLQVLLDDPVRGAGAFWKTRPPSGAPVFTCKAVFVILVAIIIPLAAEAVFLRLAAPAGGFYERMALYFLPPVVALSAGAIASSWRRAMTWLPVVLVALWACAALFAWLIIRGTALFVADPWLITAAALVMASVCAFAGYVRRNAGPVFAGATVLLPGLTAVSVAASGWSLVSAANSTPPGVAAAGITVTWRENEVPLRRLDNGYGDASLALPLTIHGMPDGFALRGRVHGVVISPVDRDSFGAGVNDNAHIKELLNHPPGHSGVWSVSVTREQAEAIVGRACTVRGKIALLLAARTRGRIPLRGTHMLGESNRRWTTQPGPDSDGDVWYRVELTGHAQFAPVQTTIRIDAATAALRRTGGPEILKLQDFMAQHDYQLYDYLNLWEGVGRVGERLVFPAQSREEKQLRRQLATDPASREGWEIHFDVLTPGGRLEVPFELQVTAGR